MDKDVVLNLRAVSFLLAGSTFGVILRIFLKNNFRKTIGFNINSISIVNILAALLLGGFVALNPLNNNQILLFYVGFLGCLSTFSSFIYQLFELIQRRDFLRFFLHYIEVLIVSFLFFFLGYYLIKIFYNWIKILLY